MLELEEDIEVVGEASGAVEALRKAKLLSPDVVFMEIRMPNANGLEATRRLSERGITAKVIFLSIYGEYLNEAIQAGAAGYLLMDAKGWEMAHAVRTVMRGKFAIGGGIAKGPARSPRHPNTQKRRPRR